MAVCWLYALVLEVTKVVGFSQLLTFLCASPLWILIDLLL